MEVKSGDGKKEVSNAGKKPGLYEIAAKIATFCDELDKSVKEGKE